MLVIRVIHLFPLTLRRKSHSRGSASYKVTSRHRMCPSPDRHNSALTQVDHGACASRCELQASWPMAVVYVGPGYAEFGCGHCMALQLLHACAAHPDMVTLAGGRACEPTALQTVTVRMRLTASTSDDACCLDD